MTRANFEIALQKGEVGEKIIKAHLESLGWVVYRPETTGAHCFDMLSIKDKRTAVAIDVKAKSRLNYLPATGINQKHFEEYKAFSEKHLMPFWLIFVDEGQKKIYGNCLEELEKPRLVDGKEYPCNISRGMIRIWPLEAMKPIGIISDQEASELSKYNQRNYEFEVA